MPAIPKPMNNNRKIGYRISVSGATAIKDRIMHAAIDRRININPNKLNELTDNGIAIK